MSGSSMSIFAFSNERKNRTRLHPMEYPFDSRLTELEALRHKKEKALLGKI